MFRSFYFFCLAGVALFGAAPDFAPSVPLTVVLDIKDHHYSADSLTAMEGETQRIIDATGMKLDWRLKSELPDHAEFANVVVFTLTGSCRMDMTPVLIDERGPLALSYTSGGEVLPFGEVRCDRVKASIQRAQAMLDPHRTWDATFGIALGRVMAHELYHMLSEEGNHTGDGVSRKSLTASQLVSGDLQLDAAALQRIRSHFFTGEQK